MAVSYFEIDTQQLSTDVKTLEENTEKARQCLENVQESLTALNSTWEGKANLAFRIAFQNDYEFMEEILTRLDKLAECMTYAGKEYVRCESDVKSLVDSIQI